ncbi:MAG: hypothetical protein E7503_05085 [Ruminococcus sp.]|nr:hypothetical protein [Ruminococcus sp.]
MKKLIATLASLALLAGACVMPAAAEETYSLGDVTMDGKVDTVDVMAVLDHYCLVEVLHMPSPLTDEQTVLAEVIGEGIIDTLDAFFILQYYSYTLTTDEPISPEEFFKQ